METKDTVVTIKNGSRQIAMYFQETNDGALDMQMAIDPEPKENEEPDLPLMLASTLLSALKIDDEPKVYDGQN